MLKLSLPKHEVILPVTGKKLFVHPLTVKDHAMINESEILTMSGRLDFVSRLAFDKLIQKEMFQNSLESFQRSIYEYDLEAMIYGILKATYREPVTFYKVCPYCQQIQSFDVSIEDIIKSLKVNTTNDTVYSDVHSIEVKDVGLAIRYTFPTIYRLIKTFEFAESNGINFLKESVKADSIVSLLQKFKPYYILATLHSLSDTENNTLNVHVTDKHALKEALDILQQLPIDSIDYIYTVLVEKINIYHIKFGFKAICQNKECKSFKEKIGVDYDVDLLSDFFPIPVKKLLE